MPPRRSTRSTRPSVEPEQPAPPPAPTTAAAKRKRSQAVADEPIVEKEIVAKPGRKPASTRSSIGTSKVKASARPRASLKDVEESGDEGVEEAPPVKKVRPSPEVEDSEDEDEYQEEEVVKPKGRKSVAVKEIRNDDSEEEPPKAKAATKTRKSTAKPILARKSTTRKSAAKPLPQEDSEDEDAAMAASAEKPPPKSRKALPVPAAKPAEDDDDSEVELMPTKKKSALKAKSTMRQVAISSSDDTQEATPPTAQIEEIEESLLDPIPPPISQHLPQAPPSVEESKGPKSRLTIHKMALVNFKSYANRQEIGPFHKVCKLPLAL